MPYPYINQSNSKKSVAGKTAVPIKSILLGGVLHVRAGRYDVHKTTINATKTSNVQPTVN